MPSFVLSDFLPYRLSVAASRVSKAFERRYMEEAGISVSEWRVLAHLTQQSEVSVREIEAMVDMEKSKVSRAATRLHQQGLIAKVSNSDDRRLVSLSLTPAGHALMERLIPLAQAYHAEMLALLGRDGDAFTAGLSKLEKGEL